MFNVVAKDSSKVSLRYGQMSKGSVSLEALVLLPVFLFLSLGIMDLGNAFNLYFQTNRISYEGARFGAIMPGMELGACENGCPTGVATMHRELQARIQALLGQNNIDPSSVTIRTERVAGTSNLMSVSISVPYSPILPGNNFLTGVRTVSQSAYMFKS